jgi:hypothetical protein
MHLRAEPGLGAAVRHARPVTYTFQVLPMDAARLRAEVADAIEAERSWQRFVEVRMGAGPTVRLDRLDAAQDTYEVTVTWGHIQEAHARVRGQEAALEAADRLAFAFYGIRDGSRVADDA